MPKRISPKQSKRIASIEHDVRNIGVSLDWWEDEHEKRYKRLCGVEDGAAQQYLMLGQLAKRVDDAKAYAVSGLQAHDKQVYDLAARLDTLQRDMQERVAAMDDRYNGLSGFVDTLAEWRDADLQRIRALELTQDAMIQPKPAPWYTRAWQSLCGFGRFLRDAYREEVEELPDFNVTHPMTKGAKLVKVGWSESDGTKGERYTWTAIDDNAVSAINTNGETQPCPTDSVCADLQTVHLCNPTEFKAWQEFSSTWNCPTCHDTDPLCTSVGAPHGAGKTSAELAVEIADLELTFAGCWGVDIDTIDKSERLLNEYREAKKREGK
jgi:hypothetical protein